MQTYLLTFQWRSLQLQRVCGRHKPTVFAIDYTANLHRPVYNGIGPKVTAPIGVYDLQPVAVDDGRLRAIPATLCVQTHLSCWTVANFTAANWDCFDRWGSRRNSEEGAFASEKKVPLREISQSARRTLSRAHTSAKSERCSPLFTIKQNAG